MDTTVVKKEVRTAVTGERKWYDAQTWTRKQQNTGIITGAIGTVGSLALLIGSAVARGRELK